MRICLVRCALMGIHPDVENPTETRAIELKKIKIQVHFLADDSGLKTHPNYCESFPLAYRK